MRYPMIAAAVLLAGAAMAQPPKVWTDAPVPGIGPVGIAPADRAGSIAGPDTSSPFSGLPSGSRTGGQATQTSRESESNTDNSTPNLSR